MKNDCQNWNFRITVWMATSEWLNLEEVYEVYDGEDGSIMKTSVVRECVEEDWGIPVMACTFELGNIQDW